MHYGPNGGRRYVAMEVERAIRESARFVLNDARETMRKARRGRYASVKFTNNWTCASIWALIDVANKLKLERLAKALEWHVERISKQMDALAE